MGTDLRVVDWYIRFEELKTLPEQIKSQTIEFFMGTFWNWIIRNISHVFSFLGLCLTLYFGVFYVPGWLEDVQKEKFRGAQENLEQSVKELIFSDSLATFAELNSLI